MGVSLGARVVFSGDLVRGFYGLSLGTTDSGAWEVYANMHASCVLLMRYDISGVNKRMAWWWSGYLAFFFQVHRDLFGGRNAWILYTPFLIPLFF